MQKTASDYLKLFHSALAKVKEESLTPMEAALAISKAEKGVSLRDCELIFGLICFTQKLDSAYLLKLNQMMREGRIDALTAVSIDKMIKKIAVKENYEAGPLLTSSLIAV